jgi:endonuclease/exonuclease/phosphatase family metal-dependent hydrolase
MKEYSAPRSDVIRIASYNIHGAKGRDGTVNLSRIGADLNDVDFAGLYEVHASPFRVPPDQASRLSDLLGWESTFLATERRWWHDNTGNAILTTLLIENVQRIPLLGTRGKAFRQAVLVDLPLDDAVVHVLMTHLDSQQDREPQLKAVRQLFEALESPAILMGDLNSGPRDPQILDLLSQPGVESVLDTNSGDHIDWIIVRGLECVAAELVESGASDHPVVKATLRLPDASAKRR